VTRRCAVQRFTRAHQKRCGAKYPALKGGPRRCVTTDEGLDRTLPRRNPTVDDSMTPEVARVYRQALTYALDEMAVT
jgi:hypothetical protein